MANHRWRTDWVDLHGDYIMATLPLKARAKNPGHCALAGCQMDGDKIYEADGLRLLACSEGHAKAVLQRIETAVKRTGATRAQRDAALRVFNSRPVKEVAEFDIPL